MKQLLRLENINGPEKFFVADKTKPRASVERLREAKNNFEDSYIAHFLAHVNPQNQNSIAVSAAWPLATKARWAYVAPYGLRLRSLAKGINAGRPYDYKVSGQSYSEPAMSYGRFASADPVDIRQRETWKVRGDH